MESNHRGGPHTYLSTVSITSGDSLVQYILNSTSLNTFGSMEDS